MMAKAEEDRARDKWGKASMAGWQPLPDVLLKNQYKMKLSPTEMMVLINILSFWWFNDSLPYPAVATIAKRMNVSSRTVQRSISSLIEKKFLTRKTIETADGENRDVYDPRDLVLQLEAYAVTDKDFLHRQEKSLRQDMGGTSAKEAF